MKKLRSGWKLTSWIKKHSKLILNEVVGNLHKKFPEHILQEFLQYLPQSNFKKVDYLITLDQKHLLSLKMGDFPFRILSPGDFIGILANKT